MKATAEKSQARVSQRGSLGEFPRQIPHPVAPPAASPGLGRDGFLGNLHAINRSHNDSATPSPVEQIASPVQAKSFPTGVPVQMHRLAPQENPDDTGQALARAVGGTTAQAYATDTWTNSLPLPPLQMMKWSQDLASFPGMPSLDAAIIDGDLPAQMDWGSMLDKVSPFKGLGNEVLKELGSDAAKEAAFDAFMRYVFIPTLRLDSLLKQGVDWAKSSLKTLAIPYVKAIEIVVKILNYYTSLSPNTRAVIKYVLGVSLNYIEKLIAWVVSKTIGEKWKFQFMGGIETVLALDDEAFCSAYKQIMALAQGILSDNPATAIFNATSSYLYNTTTSYVTTAGRYVYQSTGPYVSAAGYYVWSKVSGYMSWGSSPTSVDTPTTTTTDTDTSTTSSTTDTGTSTTTSSTTDTDTSTTSESEETTPKKPKVSKVKAGPLEIGLEQLKIAKSSDDLKGGLEAGFYASMSMFGKTASIGKGDENAKARLDWDGNFSVDYNCEKSPKKIVPGFDLFSLFSMDGIFLERLIVSNTGLVMLTAKIGSLNFGDYLTAENLKGHYDKNGFMFSVDPITLALPEPIDLTGKASIDLATDPKGAFKSLLVTNATVGSFKLQEAFLDKTGPTFKLLNMGYELPSPLDSFEAMLMLLEMNSSGIIAAKGGLKVTDWSPVEGFTVSGAAVISLLDGKWGAGLEDVTAALKKGPVEGSAVMPKLGILFKSTPEVTGKLEALNFVVGPLSFLAENATLDNTGLSIAVAGLVFSPGESEARDKITELDQSGSLSWLSSLPMSGALQILAKDITLKKGEGLKVGSYDASVKIPALSLSLFGGLLRGAINPEAGTASLAGKVVFPPSPKFWPSFGVSMPLHPTPLLIFVEAGLDGGILAELKVDLKKPQTPADYSYEGKLSGNVKSNLDAYLRGGVKLGTEWIAALRAYLEARAGVTANGSVTSTFKLGTNSDGQVGEIPTKPKRERPSVDFDFNAGIQAGVSFKVDFKTFITASRELYKYNLKTWDLGSANIKGHLGEKDGKYQLEMEKPEPKADPASMGGALNKDISVPDNFLQPLSPREALANIKGKIPTRTLYRLIHDVKDPANHISEPEQLNLMETIKSRAKSLKDFTEASGAVGTHLEARTGDNMTYIMKYPEWERYSTTKGVIGDSARKSIRTIDDLIKAYHGLTNTSLKKAKLLQLKEAVTQYLRQSGVSRKPMVTTLWSQISQEEKHLDKPSTTDSLESVASDYGDE